MSIDISGRDGNLIKIGAVARHFNISVDLLRLYEREGLLLPIKSSKGTRYFTARDYDWIGTLLRLVREARLNFAGIRHLLALLPCWELHQCDDSKKVTCPTRGTAAAPCWMKENCCREDRNCYECGVYRSAPSCANLRALLSAPAARIAAD